jgi:hypothetical protein
VSGAARDRGYRPQSVVIAVSYAALAFDLGDIAATDGFSKELGKARGRRRAPERLGVNGCLMNVVDLLA